MEKPQFEDDIRSKVEGYASQPAPDLWNRLEGKMNQPVQAGFTRMRIPLAAAASIATLALTYVFLSPSKKSELDPVLVQQGIVRYKNPGNEPSPTKTGQWVAGARPIANEKPHSEDQQPAEMGTSLVKETVSGQPNRGPNPRMEDQTESYRATNATVSHKLKHVADSTLGRSETLNVTARNSIRIPSLKIHSEHIVDAFVPPNLSRVFRPMDTPSQSSSPSITAKPSIQQKENKATARKSSWIAVGFASGNYHQQILTGSPDAGSSRASSMYYGWNLGRLSLYTGVAISEQQYNRTSSLATGPTNLRKAVSTDMIGTSGAPAEFYATNTYEVNTKRQYLSMPIQAGWFVVDRRVKGLISVGVMTDYFLSSTISDVSGSLQSSKVSRNSGSSYAGWIFSGTAGTEWSMGLMKNYQVSISPGVRYGLNPVYKKDYAVNGKSYAFDVAVRLRYFLDR